MHRPGSLIGLTIVALALAVVVALDRPDAPSVHNRRIVPEYDQAQLAAVTVTHADGHAVEVRRTADGDFDLAGGVADDEAVRALLGTIDLLSYRRRAPAAESAERGFDTPNAVVRIELTSGARIELRVGARSGAGDLVWLARADRAEHYLVDGYAARHLARRVDDLRSRRVVDADSVTGVEIYRGDDKLVFSGTDERMSVHLDGRVRADAGVVARMVKDLRMLRIVRFADADGDADDAPLSIRVVGSGGVQDVGVFGACGENLRSVASPVGHGCVDNDRILSLTQLLDDRADLVERRLFVGRIAAIAAGDVDLTAAGGSWKINEAPADPDAVGEWIDAVNRAATGETTAAAGQRLFDITITYAAGDPDTVHIARAGGRLLARRAGDDRSLVLASDSVLATPPDPGRFRSRQLILMQPTSVRELISLRGTTIVEHLTRGDLIGDWNIEAGGATVVAAAARAARDELARLRAGRFLPPGTPLSPRVTIEVAFDPPPVGDSTEPLRHRVHVGDTTKTGGCRARLDDDEAIFELGADACAALLGPWTR